MSGLAGPGARRGLAGIWRPRARQRRSTEDWLVNLYGPKAVSTSEVKVRVGAEVTTRCAELFRRHLAIGGERAPFSRRRRRSPATCAAWRQSSPRGAAAGPRYARPARDAAGRRPGACRGRVLAADNGRPVKRARVFITAAELPGGRGVLTDDSGAFDFAELPAGRYTLTASKSGFIGLRMASGGRCRRASPLQLADGQQLRGIDFRPAARRRGRRATSSTRTATRCPGAMVRVMRYQYQQGERRLVPAGTGADRRQGRVPRVGLNPGDYYVSAVTRIDLGIGGGGGRGAPGRGAPQCRGRYRERRRRCCSAGTSPRCSGVRATIRTVCRTRRRYFPGVASINEARSVSGRREPGSPRRRLQPAAGAGVPRSAGTWTTRTARGRAAATSA